MHGKDPVSSANFGGDILKNRVENSTSLFGNFIGQGEKTQVYMGTIRASYMLHHNVFLDFSQTLRRDSGEAVSTRTKAFSQAGLRLNTAWFDPHF
jgi:hypothetical protein